MMKNNLVLLTMIMVMAINSISCKKTEYSLGNLTAPTNLTMSVSVNGYDSIKSKGGDGSGIITLNISNNNALAYTVNFGDSTDSAIQTFTTTSKKYVYRNNGDYNYIITLRAIGTGGAVSTISANIFMHVLYKLDTLTEKNLTGNSSKVWVIDHDNPGHIGVGPTTTFTPDYYSASPNGRSPCLYDDEVTFSLIQDSAIHKIYMALDNKGESFIINAATAFYGQGTNSGDNCYSIDPGGKKLLSFMDATSSSTASISTRKQFNVSGNGLVAFGTGGMSYEILTLTDSTMQLRNIGADGLAWYQKFKKK